MIKKLSAPTKAGIAVGMGALCLFGILNPHGFSRTNLVQLEQKLTEAKSLLPQTWRQKAAPVTFEIIQNLPNHAYYHSESQSIQVSPDFAQAPDTSILLHELAHAVGQGARPQNKFGRRIVASIEEGVADYLAASFGRVSSIGSKKLGEVRDLNLVVRTHDWAYLISPRYVPHILGSELARQLFQQHGPSKRLALALTTCLNSKEPWTQSAPVKVSNEFLARCPQWAKTKIERSLNAWLGPELSKRKSELEHAATTL